MYLTRRTKLNRILNNSKTYFYILLKKRIVTV